MKERIRTAVRGLWCLGWRKAPLKSGLSRVVYSRMTQYCFRGVAGEHLVRLRNGMRMWVDAADYNGQMLLLFGTPDPKVVALCRRLLRQGDCFLDMGANHGAVGLLCRDAVGPEGKVHLFEPQPGLCGRIRWCLEDAGERGVEVHEVALSDCAGTLQLNLRPGHSGAASLTRMVESTQSISVPTWDVGECVPRLVEGRAFGVKLDVEGAELPILRRLVQMAGLRFVVFECNDAESRRPIWEVLQGAGLGVYGLKKSLLRVGLRPIQEIGQMARYHDYVAMREGE